MKITDHFPLPKDLFQRIFLALSLTLGLILPLLSQHYAITWDEWMDSNIGSLVLKYILSGGQNTSYTSFWHGYLYSSFFFTLVGALGGIIFDSLRHFVFEGFFQTDHYFHFFQLSHLVNSLFGFYLFFFTGLCAKEVKGWRAACLALILIAVSPRIFGHSMNNPKDIPFAATYMLAAYFMIRFFKQMPRPGWKITGLLSIAIGLSIGCRVGGIILIVYLFVFGGLFYAYRRFKQKELLPLTPWLGRALLVALYGYLIGLLFWPYGQINPFLNIFRALSKLSDFRFSVGNLLFQGRLQSITELPWHYVPFWILITTPLVVILGWLLLGVFSTVLQKDMDRKSVLFLVCMGVFPIATVILKHSVLYNDWRHLYFVYGPLVVLSALGWDQLFDMIEWKKLRLGLGIFFLVLVSGPVIWMIRNHPLQALYFNNFVGGMPGAAGRYDMDYWGNSLRKAAEWLGDYHLSHYPDQPAVVKADGYPMTTYAVLREKLGSRYFPFMYPDKHLHSRQFRYLNIHLSRSSKNTGWDYAIYSLNQQTRGEMLLEGWPPLNALYEVKVDGVTVCAVIKNPDSPLSREKAAV